MNNSTLGKLALTAAVAVAGVGFLVKSSMSSASHYMMVDDLLKTELTQWQGKELKVHGFVETGSIVQQIVNQETHRTFVLQKAGKKIRVFSSGPVPDTFKNESEVVAMGHLVPAAKLKPIADSLKVALEPEMTFVVDATELQAKCPSRYEGAKTNQKLDPNTPQFK